MRRPLCEVRLKRVICRVADVIDQIYRSVLRANDNEVLRKACVEQKTARPAVIRRRRQRLVLVDEIGETADVAVRDEAVGRCGSAQSLRCSQSAHAYGAHSTSKVD